jgi:hypothetical protein
MEVFRLLYVGMSLQHFSLAHSNSSFREGTGGRTLTNGLDVAGGSSNMTVSNCLAACQASKYNLAGVEYSGECCRSTLHDAIRMRPF